MERGENFLLASSFFMFLCPYCLPSLCFLVPFFFPTFCWSSLFYAFKGGLHISSLCCCVKFPTALLRVIWNADNKWWIGKQSEGRSGSLITTSLLQNSLLPTGTRTVYARTSQSVTAISMDHESLTEFRVKDMDCGLHILQMSLLLSH